MSEVITKDLFNCNEGSHSCCDTILFTCTDFRFWMAAIKYLNDFLGITECNFPSLPGAAKAFNDAARHSVAMNCIDIHVELHNSDTVILINHEDCGAYGGSRNFSSKQEERFFHIQELKRAEALILVNQPDIEVILVYASFKINKEIEFSKIN